MDFRLKNQIKLIIINNRLYKMRKVQFLVVIVLVVFIFSGCLRTVGRAGTLDYAGGDCDDMCNPNCRWYVAEVCEQEDFVDASFQSEPPEQPGLARISGDCDPADPACIPHDNYMIMGETGCDPADPNCLSEPPEMCDHCDPNSHCYSPEICSGDHYAMGDQGPCNPCTDSDCPGYDDPCACPETFDECDCDPDSHCNPACSDYDPCDFGCGIHLEDPCSECGDCHPECPYFTCPECGGSVETCPFCWEVCEPCEQECQEMCDEEGCWMECYPCEEDICQWECDYGYAPLDMCDPNNLNYKPCDCDPCSNQACPDYDVSTCGGCDGDDHCEEDCPEYDRCKCDDCAEGCANENSQACGGAIPQVTGFIGGEIRRLTFQERICDTTLSDTRIALGETEGGELLFEEGELYQYKGRVAALDSLYNEDGSRKDLDDPTIVWIEGAKVSLYEQHDDRQIAKYSITDEDGRFGDEFYWDYWMMNRGNGPLFASPLANVRINIQIRPRTAFLNGIAKPFFTTYAEDLGVGNSGWGQNTIIGMTRQDVTLIELFNMNDKVIASYHFDSSLADSVVGNLPLQGNELTFNSESKVGSESVEAVNAGSEAYGSFPASDLAEFSVVLWFNPDGYASDGTTAMIMSNRDVDDKAFELLYDNSNSQFSVSIQTDDLGIQDDAVVLNLAEHDIDWNLGVWYFVGVSYDGSEICLYVNDKKECDDTKVGGDVGEGGGDIYYFSAGGYGADYDTTGMIDEVAWFSIGLGSDNILKVYNNGDGQAYPFREIIREGCDFDQTTATVPPGTRFNKVLDDGTLIPYEKEHLVVALRDMGEEMNTYSVAGTDEVMVPVGVLEIGFYDPEDGLRLVPQDPIDYSGFIGPRGQSLGDISNVGMFQLSPAGWNFLQQASVGLSTSTASAAGSGMINFDMKFSNPACVSITVTEDWGDNPGCGIFQDAKFTVDGNPRNRNIGKGSISTLINIGPDLEAVIELGEQPEGCPAPVLVGTFQTGENTFSTGAGAEGGTDCVGDVGSDSNVQGCRSCIVISADGQSDEPPTQDEDPIQCGRDLHGYYEDIESCADSIPDATSYFQIREDVQSASRLSIDPGNRFVFLGNDDGPYKNLNYVHDATCEVTNLDTASAQFIPPLISSQRRRVLYGEQQPDGTTSFKVYDLRGDNIEQVADGGYSSNQEGLAHAHDMSSYGDAAAIALSDIDLGNNPDGSTQLYSFVANYDAGQYDGYQLTSATETLLDEHLIGRVEYLWTSGCEDEAISIGHAVGYASNLGLDNNFIKTIGDENIIEFFVSYYRLLETGDIQIDRCQATTDGETYGVDVFRVSSDITTGDIDDNGFEDTIKERLDYVAEYMVLNNGACPLSACGSLSPLQKIFCFIEEGASDSVVLDKINEWNLG